MFFPRSSELRSLLLVGLFALALAFTVGCPNTIKAVKETAKLISDSPRPGGSTHSVHLVDQGSSLGFMHDLAVIDGKPALAYRAPDGLHFAQATVPHPQSAADWKNHLVDSTDRAGAMVKMLVSDGRPFLLYGSGKRPDNQYKYAYAVTPEPESDADWKVVEFTEEFGVAIGHVAEMIDGRPAFISRNPDTKAKTYFYADTAIPDGLDNWTGVSFTAEEYPFYGIRLVDIDNLPLITVMKENQNEFVALTGSSSAPAGINDWSSELIFDSQGVSLGVMDQTLACIDGQPAMTFAFDEPPELRYAWREKAADGKTTWQVSPVLNWADWSSGIDLIDVEGRPLIAYSFWAQAFAIHADSAAPANPKDWLMAFATEDVAKGDYRTCRGAYVDGKVVMSIFGFDTGQGEGLFFSVLE